MLAKDMNYRYNVDLGDGIAVDSNQYRSELHRYAKAGIYTVSITGYFPRIFFYNAYSKDKIVEVSHWGTEAWTSMNSAFNGCTNLNITATVTPVFSGVKNMSGMFAGCTSLNPTGAAATAMNTWNTSAVTDMSAMLFRATFFNQNIGSWNTGAVRNMQIIFANATSFNYICQQNQITGFNIPDSWQKEYIL